MDFNENGAEELIELRDHKMTPAKKMKIVFKSIFYFFVLLIYGLLMLRFFVSCDLKIINRVHLSDSAREIYEANPDGFSLFNIHTPVTFNEPRSLLLKKIVYTPEGAEIELGVRFKKTLTEGSTGRVLEYKLVDSNGKEYELVYRESDAKYDYGYERIGFAGVNIDLDRNIVNRFEKGESVDYKHHQSYDEKDYETVVEANEDPENVKYKLYIYYKGVRLRAFLLYDDNVPISNEKFKP